MHKDKDSVYLSVWERDFHVKSESEKVCVCGWVGVSVLARAVPSPREKERKSGWKT